MLLAKTPRARYVIWGLALLTAIVLVYFQIGNLTVSIVDARDLGATGSFLIMHDALFYAKFLTSEIPSDGIYNPSDAEHGFQKMHWMYSPLVYSALKKLIGSFSAQSIFDVYIAIYFISCIGSVLTITFLSHKKSKAFELTPNYLVPVVLFLLLFLLSMHANLLASTAGNVSTILGNLILMAIGLKRRVASLALRATLVLIKPTWAPIMFVTSLSKKKVCVWEFLVTLAITGFYLTDIIFRPNLYVMWIDKLSSVVNAGNKGAFILELLLNPSILKFLFGVGALLSLIFFLRRILVNSGTQEDPFKEIGIFVVLVLMIPRNYIYDLLVVITFAQGFMLLPLFKGKVLRPLEFIDLVVLVGCVGYSTFQIYFGGNFFTPTAFQFLLLWFLVRVAWTCRFAAVP